MTNHILFAIGLTISLGLAVLCCYAYWLEISGQETISEWIHSRFGRDIAVAFVAGVSGFLLGHWAWPIHGRRE